MGKTKTKKKTPAKRMTKMERRSIEAHDTKPDPVSPRQAADEIMRLRRDYHCCYKALSDIMGMLQDELDLAKKSKQSISVEPIESILVYYRAADDVLNMFSTIPNGSARAGGGDFVCDDPLT